MECTDSRSDGQEEVRSGNYGREVSVLNMILDSMSGALSALPVKHHMQEKTDSGIEGRREAGSRRGSGMVRSGRKSERAPSFRMNSWKKTHDVRERRAGRNGTAGLKAREAGSRRGAEWYGRVGKVSGRLRSG
jgi:hypothetical protein